MKRQFNLKLDPETAQQIDDGVAALNARRPAGEPVWDRQGFMVAATLEKLAYSTPRGDKRQK